MEYNGIYLIVAVCWAIAVGVLANAHAKQVGRPLDTIEVFTALAVASALFWLPLLTG